MATPTKPVTARVPEDLDAALEAVALVTGLTVGAIIREALEQYFYHNWTEAKLSRELAEYYKRQRDQEEHVTQTAVQMVQTISQNRKDLGESKPASDDHAADDAA